MSIYKGYEPALLGGSAVVDDAVTNYSTWSSQKIQQEIENGGGGGIKTVKVATLPTTDIDTKTVYMVPNGETTGDNQYDKYMYIDGRWEKFNADSDAVKSGDFIQLLKDNTDDALSDTSTNPVQNKVVKEALDARYTKTEIDAKLSSTYKAAGSVANLSALPAADAAHLGYVYNVEAAFTSTADFKEGAGKSYPAGTNVAIVLDGANYKYDVLAGFVDISGKADKATTLAGYGITDAAPSSHVSDTTKHITAEERTAWNNKLGSVPVASSTNLGGVKVGNGLKAKSDGTLGQVEPTIVNMTDLFEFEEGITGVFDTTFKSLVLGNIIMLTFRADTMNAILEPEGQLNIFLNIKEPYRSRLKGRFAGTARINTEGENGGNLVTGIVVSGSNASHYPGKIYCSTPRENGGNKLTSVTFSVIGFMSDPA